MIKNMVVIGNGSSVLNYKFGTLIDSFENVARFNEYQIEGYEEFIGTKTTLWCRNSSKDTKDRDFEEVFLQKVDFPNEWTDHSIYEKYSTLDDEDIIEIRKYVKTDKNLSTGVQALSFLTKRFGHIYIHGFDNFDPPQLYFEMWDRDIKHSVDERKYIDYLKNKKLVTELSSIKFI